MHYAPLRDGSVGRKRATLLRFTAYVIVFCKFKERKINCFALK